MEKFSTSSRSRRGLGSFDCVRLAPHLAQDDIVREVSLVEVTKLSTLTCYRAVESIVSVIIPQKILGEL